MPEFAHLADRIINTPLLAHPAKAEVVAGVVMARRGVSVNVSASAEFNQAPKAGPLQDRMVRRYEEGYLEPALLVDAETGVAVIEVLGSLAHRQGYIGASSGVMGYDGIGAQLELAQARGDVRAILFDIHSAGGEVSGAFQLADRIASFRGGKPMVALADEMAFSAAYLLAAACDAVALASDVAQVGSVGVIRLHFSFQEMLKADGIEPTIIQAGAYKADGNPYQNLPEETRTRMLTEVEEVYAVFVQRVAAWRGISEAAVRATEAGVFMGQGAIDAGLADEITDPITTLTMLADLAGSRPALRAV